MMSSWGVRICGKEGRKGGRKGGRNLREELNPVAYTVHVGSQQWITSRSEVKLNKVHGPEELDRQPCSR